MIIIHLLATTCDYVCLVNSVITVQSHNDNTLDTIDIIRNYIVDKSYVLTTKTKVKRKNKNKTPFYRRKSGVNSIHTARRTHDNTTSTQQNERTNDQTSILAGSFMIGKFFVEFNHSVAVERLKVSHVFVSHTVGIF